MTEQKRILLVCDSNHHYRADIYELEFQGYDVTVAGEGGSLSVDDAISRIIEDEEHFDLIISNMFMPCGNDYLSLDGVNDGWTTGKAFVEFLRDEDVKTPFVFYDVSTGFMNCERYKSSKSTVGLENGDTIPVILRDGKLEEFILAIDNVINKGDTPDSETHFTL